MPPSMPPASVESRRYRWSASSQRIGSWASLPRRPATSKPSPISTPLTAWMLITAAASRASSLRSQWTWLPSPTGTPSARISTTPPSESPSFAAALTSRIIASAAAGSKQRTGDSSTCARSASDGRAPVARAAAHLHDVAEHADAELGEQQLGDGAGGDASGRLPGAGPLEHVAGIGEPVLLHPGEVGVPGRTWVSGAAVAPGAGDISACHLSLRNHSVLRISMATGEPIVRP